MAEHFKANAVGEKCKKRVEELGDKFKEVMAEPATEPFGTPNPICPRRSRDHETCATLVEPRRNLGGTQNLKNLGRTFRGAF